MCNGGRLLAATGLLDGRRATAHWSAIRGLQRRRPRWIGSAASAMSQDGTPHHHRRSDLGGIRRPAAGRAAGRIPTRPNGSARSSPTRAGRCTAPPASPRSAGRRGIWRFCWRWSVRGCGQRSVSDWSRGSASWRSPPPSRFTPARLSPAPSRSPPPPPFPRVMGCAWSRPRPTPAPPGSTGWWCLASDPSRRSTRGCWSGPPSVASTSNSPTVGRRRASSLRGDAG